MHQNPLISTSTWGAGPEAADAVLECVFFCVCVCVCVCALPISTCYQNLLIFAYGMNDDLSLCDLRFVNVVKKSKLSTAVNVKDFTL